jgi:capsule polysaccharide export protein KpsC/LpsZ
MTINGFGTELFPSIKAACLYKKKVIFLEPSFFDTWLVDSQGALYNNSISPKNGFNSRIFSDNIIDNEKAKSLTNRLLQLRHKITGIVNDTKPLPCEYILLPLQVPWDTQVVMFNSKINNMEEMIQLVHTNLQNFNEIANKNWFLVIKEHPQVSTGLYDSICSNLKNVMVVRNYNLDTLLLNAKVLVTLNSTVGLEALFYEVPIIVLGKAFYGLPDIVRDCSETLDIVGSLIHIEKNGINTELVRKYIYHLYYNILAHNHKEVSEKIKLMLDCKA